MFVKMQHTIERLRLRFLNQPINQSIKQIYIAALIVRIILICYSVIHDALFAVRFTDIDYVIFSEAAQHIRIGESPFDRATYRYTPFLAWGMYLIDWLIEPVIGRWQIGGKLVFSILDLLLAWLIDRCVVLDFQLIYTPVNQSISDPNQLLSQPVSRSINRSRLLALLFSLFNPLSLTVSTRGNADVIVTAASAGVVYALMKSSHQSINQSVNQPTNQATNQSTSRSNNQSANHWHRVAAVLWGFAVHSKLYPIIYGPAILLYLIKPQSINQHIKSLAQRSINQSINWSRLIEFFALSLITFLSLTGLAYHLDGDRFLDAAIFYHFRRADTRHNFSLYFLWLYLSSTSVNQSINQSISISSIDFVKHLVAKLAFLPQLISILITSITLFINRSNNSASRNNQSIISSNQSINSPNQSISSPDQSINRSISQSIIHSFLDSLNPSALPLTFVVSTWLFVAFNKVCTAQYFLWYLGLLPMIVHRIDCSINQSIILSSIWMVCEIHWLVWAYMIEMRGWSVFEGLHIASMLFFAANILCVTCVARWWRGDENMKKYEE